MQVDSMELKQQIRDSNVAANRPSQLIKRQSSLNTKLCSDNAIKMETNEQQPIKTQRFNIRKSRSIMNLEGYENISLLRDKILGYKNKSSRDQNQFQTLINKASVVKKDQKGQICTLAFVIDNQTRRRNMNRRSSCNSAKIQTFESQDKVSDNINNKIQYSKNRSENKKRTIVDSVKQIIQQQRNYKDHDRKDGGYSQKLARKTINSLVHQESLKVNLGTNFKKYAQKDDLSAEVNNRMNRIVRAESGQSGISFLAAADDDDKQLKRKRVIYNIEEHRNSNNIYDNIQSQKVLIKSYDIKIRSEKRLQQRLLKDQLSMLMDKSNVLKNIFTNKYKLYDVFELLDINKQTYYNIKMEKLLCNYQFISELILQEFGEQAKLVRVNENPLENIPLEKQFYTSEKEVFLQNVTLFQKMNDFLKDCIDCFYIIIRQVERYPLENKVCQQILNYIDDSRFIISQLQELYRVFDKNQQDNRKSILFYSQCSGYQKNSKSTGDLGIKKQKQSDVEEQQEDMAVTAARLHKLLPQMKKKETIINILRDEENEQIQKQNQQTNQRLKRKKLLQNLIDKKFRRCNVSIQPTRESKVALNQDKFNKEKELIIKCQQEKQQKVFADNRLKVKLEKVSNPQQMPMIKNLINKYQLKIDDI